MTPPVGYLPVSDAFVIGVDGGATKSVAWLASTALEGAVLGRGVIFTADGKTAFVSNENAGTVTVIDADKHAVVGTIQVPKVEGTEIPPLPMGLVLSPDGKTLYVSLGRAAAIAVIDVATRTVTRTITAVGTRPWGIAINAAGTKLYTANGRGANVSVVDIASGKVEKQIATGGSPWGVLVK